MTAFINPTRNEKLVSPGQLNLTEWIPNNKYKSSCTLVMLS